MKDQFNPKPWARNPHLQSIFASLRIRTLGRNPMTEAARTVIIDGGDGVRLLGYHSPRYNDSKKGMILLVHGWEGSADSTYILHTGRYLHAAGFDIMRLNLRDHGASHHLNSGLFHGALIDETWSAVSHIAADIKGMPLCIVGFSLGGNFALRIALKQSEHPLNNLRHVIAVSPLLDPYTTTRALDNGFPLYKYYFLKKWKSSLKKKQAFFPHLYDFDEILDAKSLMELTDLVIRRYSAFHDYRDYFRRYTLLGDVFSDLSMPVTIFTAMDDPMIPVTDFFGLKGNNCLELSIQPRGGHCGFLDPFPFGCWYEKKIHDICSRYENF